MNVQLKKASPLILVIILAVIFFTVRRCQDQQDTRTATTTSETPKKQETGSVNREKGFDRRVSYLDYSDHAKCRMDCRKISKSEVEQIMQGGKVNYGKSDISTARCPRYAVEGITSDDQRVRIVFAQCNKKTTVVTVIDLDTEWTCHCPGDDKKYDNKN